MQVEELECSGRVVGGSVMGPSMHADDGDGEVGDFEEVMRDDASKS